MKRALVLLGSLCILTGVLRAADAVTIATQQEAEERMKRLAATIEEFQTSQAAQQKQINMLGSDVSKLREDAARNNNNTETQVSIHQIKEQIRELDKARLADNKRIQEAMDKLALSIKEIANMPPPPSGRTPRVPPNNPPPSSDNTGGGSRTPTNNGPQLGFDYIIKSGDALSIIVQKYRKEGINVTAQSIKEANPNVDWDRLQIGKKIFIPKPAK